MELIRGRKTPLKNAVIINDDMRVYKAWVKLEEEYDDIEADSEEEAFTLASDYAMSGGSWEYDVEEVE